MNSQTILALMRGYLERSLTENVGMSDEVIEEFGELCKKAVKRRFQEGPSKDFTLRMSNIGKPVCQLRYEKAGAPKESNGYSHAMMMVYGDLIEALTYAIIRGSGIKVEGFQEPVSIDLSHKGKKIGKLSGTYDVKLYGAVYDIKSASSYAYTNKFSPDHAGSFSRLKDNDDFGYVSQGYGYAIAASSSSSSPVAFGGWIAVNKETGEISILEASQDKREYKEAYEKIVASFLRASKPTETNTPIEREFAEEAETFSKKETGNTKLGRTCTYCQYKWTCWPTLELAPRAQSTAASPPMVHYVYLDPKYKTDEHAVTEGQGEESPAAN